MTEEQKHSIEHLKQLQIESAGAAYAEDWQRVAEIAADQLLIVERLLINRRIDAVERGAQ